jgi:hypothetical protein
VFCGGDPSKESNYEERTIIARRVTDPKQLTRLNEAAQRLKGGDATYSQGTVTSAVQSADAVYVYDSTTEDGKPILTPGQAIGNYLAFRANDWANIQSGPGYLNREVLSNYRGTACGTIGHEGVHLVQHARGVTVDTERIALAIRWSCR